MGTRCSTAQCNNKECEQNDDDGQFRIVMEWMDKKELLIHIRGTKCPYCGGDDWYLTDISEI